MHLGVHDLYFLDGLNVQTHDFVVSMFVSCFRSLIERALPSSINVL